MARRLPIDGGGSNAPPASTSSGASPLEALIASFADLDADQLRLQWRNHLGGTPPTHLPRWLLANQLERPSLLWIAAEAFRFRSENPRDRRRAGKGA